MWTFPGVNIVIEEKSVMYLGAQRREAAGRSHFDQVVREGFPGHVAQARWEENGFLPLI